MRYTTPTIETIAEASAPICASIYTEVYANVVDIEDGGDE